MLPPICPRIPPSRPTLVKALVIGRAGSGKVQWGLRRGTDWAPPVRDHAQAAEERITVEALESHVWRLREGFSRNERASWYQSTLFGRRAAQQRGAIAAALHIADGALSLLERRAQGLRRGGENHREASVATALMATAQAIDVDRRSLPLFLAPNATQHHGV